MNKRFNVGIYKAASVDAVLLENGHGVVIGFQKETAILLARVLGLFGVQADVHPEGHPDRTLKGVHND